jgi:hypothetical protein
MPSVYDFLESAGMIAIFNAIIFFAGRAMLRSMKQKGQFRRAFHGWYVWVWMMGGVIVGGCFMPWNTSAYIRGGPLLLGLGTGWIGGTIHGLIALQRIPNQPPSEDDRDHTPPS